MSGFTVRARLRLATDQGYRTAGWRGVCSFAGITAPDGDSVFGCELRLIGTDRLEPGQEGEAALRFWVSLNQVAGLVPGLAMRLLEGERSVATGVVEGVLEE